MSLDSKIKYYLSKKPNKTFMLRKGNPLGLEKSKNFPINNR